MSTTTKKAGHELNFSLFGYAILIANAILTFGFGMTFGLEIIDTGSAGLSKFLGGLMMTLFFDLAALGWFAALRLPKQSPTQRSIAMALALVSIIASTLVSAIQLGMTTTLIDLSGSRDIIGTFGLGLVVTIAAAHFIGYFRYKATSVAAQQADLEAERQATLAQAKLDQQRLIDDKTTALTEQYMLDEVDTIARMQAQMRVRMIKASFHGIGQAPIDIEDAQLDTTAPPPSAAEAVEEVVLPQVETSPGGLDPRPVPGARSRDAAEDQTTPPPSNAEPEIVEADRELTAALVGFEFDKTLNGSGNGQSANGQHH